MAKTVKIQAKDGIFQVEPKLGEGIYLVKDVAKILNLDYEKTYRWISGYWGIGQGGGLDENTNYTFGSIGNRAINFFSLIEFYTFFKLREKGVSSTEIKRLHKDLSNSLNTPYPFAIAHDYFIEGRRRKTFVYYKHLGSLIKHDKRFQFSLSLVETFLDKIEFDNNNIATRFFPLSDSKNVVVDPKHQFGAPTITGTNIKVSTLTTHYLGGDSVTLISKIYNIKEGQVRDAIQFDLDKAA